MNINKKLLLNTEIRHISSIIVSELSDILESHNTWCDIMALIPNERLNCTVHTFNINVQCAKKYTSESIRLVLDECKREGKAGFETLVEEWGTSGQVRPKVGHLLSLLSHLNHQHAIDILRSNLDECDLESFNKLANPRIQSVEDPLSHNYAALQALTNNFSDLPIESGGCKLGQGAFGAVYKVMLSINGEVQPIALKKLINFDSKGEAQFQNEIKILSKCNHCNVLSLVGYSVDGPQLCLLYTFMPNGSLSDRLACVNNTPPIEWKLRVSILLGIAEGISYLHTQMHPPIIHRDIKSGNLLLDKDFAPKVGDFGLVRRGSSDSRIQSDVRTSTVFGTGAYMAPEAFRGDVSPKMDTFSYGIVLLEVLTGLPPIDDDREGIDLLTHFLGLECDSCDLLDYAAGGWDTRITEGLFGLANECTEVRKEKRLAMPAVVDKLKRIGQEYF